MQHFYHPAPVPSEIVLDPDQSRHAVKVLRLRAGDMVTVADGRGVFYAGKISDPSPAGCGIAELSPYASGKKAYRLTIGIAPPKNPERFEWFLEKATEMGIDRVVPLLCAHSERRVLKVERERRIVLSAMQQSMGAWLPEIGELTPFEKFVPQASGVKLIGWCGEGVKMTPAQAILPGEDITFLIGPEGDFSLDEVSLASEYGFRAVTLGENRLRTETAALMVAALAAAVNVK